MLVKADVVAGWRLDPAPAGRHLHLGKIFVQNLARLPSCRPLRVDVRCLPPWPDHLRSSLALHSDLAQQALTRAPAIRRTIVVDAADGSAAAAAKLPNRTATVVALVALHPSSGATAAGDLRRWSPSFPRDRQRRGSPVARRHCRSAQRHNRPPGRRADSAAKFTPRRVPRSASSHVIVSSELASYDSSHQDIDFILRRFEFDVGHPPPPPASR